MWEHEAGGVLLAFSRRFPFLVTIALVAAALGDPFVESVSNTGIFGGSYADNNHLGVLPALFVGGALLLALATLRCAAIWHSSRDDSGAWLKHAARDIAGRSPWYDLVFVLGVQLALLFALESCEQLVAAGTLLGGLAWLGGPILFSLTAHALIGLGCLFALRSLMRAIARTFAALVHAALGLLWVLNARSGDAAVHLFGYLPLALRAQAPNVRQIGGRAPPLLQTPA
jgi:hypothetical protein